MKKRQRSIQLTVTLGCVLFMTSWSYAQTTILRVDGDNGLTLPQGATGDNWAEAFKFLQDALSLAAINASEFNPHEIWVAATHPANHYRPDVSSFDLPPDGSGDPTDSFNLLNHVKIFGGFAGGETQLSERNFLANVTVLSGNFTQYHVVFANVLVDESAVLNGFTIEKGRAGGVSPVQRRGGGIFSDCGAAPVIVNCTITNNGARDAGGGVFCESLSNASFVNCRIIDNAVDDLQGGGDGGGLARGRLDPGLESDFTRITLTNCLIARNTAEGFGGGISLRFGGGVTIANCTIVENTTRQTGGGYFEAQQLVLPGPSVVPSVIVNSVLWGNTILTEVVTGRQIFLEFGDGIRLSVEFSDVEGGEGAVGGDKSNLIYGPNNIDDDPLFEDDGPGGNYRLKCASPARNSGDTPETPLDDQDVDDDLDTTEKTPDLDLNFRVINFNVVDMGSFESHSDCPLGDCAGPGAALFDGPPDGVVDLSDLAAVQAAMGLPGGPCDVFPACSGDGFVDIDDFNFVRTHFGEQCGGIPAGAGGPGGWGDWQSEPWAYGLLYAHGLADWDEFNAWVPVADINELGAFVDTVMFILTPGQ